MQEVKNKLAMFNALRCDDSAAADLKLLAERCPQHPDMARFTFSPKRNADDILFALLDHATEDDILENRMENEQGKIDENGGDGHIQTEGEDEQTADGNNDETSEGQSSKFENETEGEGDEEDMPTETDGKQPATTTCVENGSEQTDEHQAVPQDKVPKAKDAKKK
jgi:hypothetical protein|nr:MAG TPA: hypothetical protein [Caudoviricetes sp.]